MRRSAFASVSADCTTPARGAATSGAFDTSRQALKKEVSTVLKPPTPGSRKTVSASRSDSAVVVS